VELGLGFPRFGVGFYSVGELCNWKLLHLFSKMTMEIVCLEKCVRSLEKHSNLFGVSKTILIGAITMNREN